MAFLVLAYPRLARKDLDMIQAFRLEHDKLLYNVVQPHFTFVFRVFDLSEEELVSDIRARAAGTRKFNFVLRAATISKDAFKDYFHVFLVPDEGHSNMLLLHDKLYGGNLRNNLRLDLDYIPHMSIGNSMDRYKCKALVEEWNARNISITGTIESLTIVSFVNSTVTELQVVTLDE